MITEAFDYKIKVVIIGDSMVGKSCVIFRYTNNIFTSTHLTTLGVDFHVKDLVFCNKKIKLQLWDTAGQERFHAISSSYCRGSDGVIFAFDMTNINSFKNMKNWINAFSSKDEEMVKILIATKSDLINDRQVSNEQGKQLAEKNNMMFFETSAKENVNIKDVFESLVGQMIDKMNFSARNREIEGSFLLKDGIRKKKCCQ